MRVAVLYLVFYLGFMAPKTFAQVHEIHAHAGLPVVSAGYQLQLEYTWVEAGRILSAGYCHYRYQDQGLRYRAQEWYFSPGYRWPFRKHWFWDFRLGPALYYGPSEFYSRGSGEAFGPPGFLFSLRGGHALTYQPDGGPWGFSLRAELNTAVESMSPSFFQVSLGTVYRFAERP